MSSPLTYFPAYLGLFTAQVLAIACNAFLDIQYGSFGLEVLLWAIAFGVTLGVGWLQRGEITQKGRLSQKIALGLGLILFVLLFMPMWGLPRAGLALLGALQAGYNCVTVTRRHLHLGLLVSSVMVMFAASHFRAHWSMLFYLVPYVMAVVFTLVAEQINRRAQDLRKQSLGHQVLRGQWVAIAAATSVILLLSAFLYGVTPQFTWPYVQWRYGQLTNIGLTSGPKEGGRQGQSGAEESGDSGKSSQTQGSTGPGPGNELVMGYGWPSQQAMRAVAKRPGMPKWQSSAINSLADGGEWVSVTMKPVMQSLAELWQDFKDWLHENRTTIVRLIAIVVLLALLYAMWRLMREAKAGIWLLTRFDYLRFGIFGLHADGNEGARQYYGAMERLFALHDAERSHLINAREYLARLCSDHGSLRRELTEMTRLFEDARYGPGSILDTALGRMRILYRQMYRSF